MSRLEWFIVIGPILLSVFFDQVTKTWASHLGQVLSYGPITFMLHHNPGAMLGLFSELPGVLRIVTLSTGGAFLLCTYALIQYLLPLNSLKLRLGLAVLIGGILGNVFDRILHGHVIDFIVIHTRFLTSPAFNLADAIQWVGYILIVTSIIKEGNKIWPENDTRRWSWVNFRFQFKYSILLTAVGVGLTLISVVFTYTYMKVTISELVGSNPIIIKRFLQPFILTYVLIGIGFCIALFTIGRILSHRIAGPIYAFEKFLREILDGKTASLRFRKKDEFQSLQKSGEDIKNKLGELRRKNFEAQNQIKILEQKLNDISKSGSQDPKAS